MATYYYALSQIASLDTVVVIAEKWQNLNTRHVLGGRTFMMSHDIQPISGLTSLAGAVKVI